VSARVAVVGGGVAGLVAALELDRAGHEVEVLERDDVLGGRFGAGRLGTRDVMFGGKNVGQKYTTFRGFVDALGDHRWEPFGINASRVKDGRVLTLDSSHRLRSLRNFRHGGSVRDLGRLAALALRVRSDERNTYLGSPYFTALARKRDHAPLAAHFGAELTQSLLRPMTIRMNGAEPDEVYLGTFGTNLALLMDTYDQLASGIQPVLDAFAQRVSVRLGTRVEALAVRDRTVTGVHVAEPDGTLAERPYDGVVVATPAYAAAPLVRPADSALATRLEGVRYFPSTVVLVEYDRPFFTHDVRALAMDEGPCTNVGAYGAEERHIVRYTFSGRHARQGDVGDERIAAWLDEAEASVRRYVLSGREARRVRTASRHWDAAYSAYVPFHGAFLDDVERAVSRLPGLELAGDYLKGVSIEACSRAGAAAAARMAAHLRGAARTATPAGVA